MHLLLMFFDFPDLLEAFTTKLAGQLFFVDFPLLPVMDVLDVSCDVVAIQELFLANVAGIVSFAGVRFHVPLHFRLGMSSEPANGTDHILLLFVHKQVLAESRVSGIALSTNWTDVVPFLQMNGVHVLPKLSFLDVSHFAHITLMINPLPVDFLV